MRKVAGYLVWLYVFTVPWDIVPLPGVGTISRLAGLAAVGFAVLTIAASGRFRKPDAIFGLATVFTVLSALSLLWTISYSTSSQSVLTGAQFLGSVWVLREFARREKQRHWLLFAFCLGAIVPMAGLLYNFVIGARWNTMPGRYTAAGFNADGIGILMAIIMPMTWHLVMTSERTVRTIALILFVLAPVVLLLTATRGAFLSGLVAFSIVPLNLKGKSLRSFFRVTVLVSLLGAAVAAIVPQFVWNRMATIPGEIVGGNMSTRKDIWTAGLDAFPERPLLGVGAGAYSAMLDSRGQHASPSHNTMLGLLVELGIAGLLSFVAVLGACAFLIFRLPPLERRLWAVLMLTLLVGMMNVNMEMWKGTWLLFGLLSAQSGGEKALRHVRRSEQTIADEEMQAAMLGRARPPRAARIAVGR